VERQHVLVALQVRAQRDQNDMLAEVEAVD
jgi:hypothetical protein